MSRKIAFVTGGAGFIGSNLVARLSEDLSLDVVVCDRLREKGGNEVVHKSPGLEVGVYVLVAPEPDRQQPHADDEIYLVLEGHGVLDVEGERVELSEGHAVFVPAGAEHRFSGYEQLIVLVIFESARRAFR